MKILIITQLYPQPDDQGDNKVTKTVQYFAREWVSQGHEVVVVHCSSKFPALLYLLPSFLKNKYAYYTSSIIPSFSSRRELFREEYGIKVYRKPMYKLFPGRPFSNSQLNTMEKIIAKIIDDEFGKPDIIVGHFANPSLQLVANLSSRYRCMSSIVFHGDCNENTIRKYRIGEHITKVNAIGVRSSAEAVAVKQLLDLKQEPFICYSGVPNASIEHSRSSCSKHDYKNGIRYLFVGSLIMRKHLDSVLKAFAEVKDTNDLLLIVGGGPEEKTLKKLSTKLGIEKQTKFVGRVSRAEVLQYMSNSHIFTLISEKEVFGMVYFESMLQGCLVIASRNGGFDGIIKNRVNGFICGPGNEEELIHIYREIKAMQTNERNMIGKNAIDMASHFSESYVATKYLQDILERNGLWKKD